ncbi:MAG: hypothetical protein AAF353_09890, partial [Pseudomonadota bacterium]
FQSWGSGDIVAVSAARQPDLLIAGPDGVSSRVKLPVGEGATLEVAGIRATSVDDAYVFGTENDPETLVAYVARWHGGKLERVPAPKCEGIGALATDAAGELWALCDNVPNTEWQMDGGSLWHRAEGAWAEVSLPAAWGKPTLYCYLASKKLTINHYAQPKERRYFQHHRTGLAMRAAAIALLAVGVGIALTSGIKGWLYNDTITETTLIEQKYKAKFNQLSENRIDSTTSTTSMQHIVQTVESIQGGYLRDPEDLMIQISNDVSIFSDIRIRNIEWFTTNYSDSQSLDDVNWERPKRRRADPNAKKTNAPPPKQGYFEVAQVEGEFIDFDGNFRYALSAVDDLEKTMSESGKYFSVEVTKRPLDIESDNRLSGDASSGRGSNLVKAELAFRVVREIKP